MTESESNSSDQSWRTNLLRSNVINKIEEAIRMSGNPTSKTVSEMENRIFLKARTKEEYLSFVARLIIYIKDMNMTESESNSGDQSWRNNFLRSNVRNKIEESIHMFGNPTSKTISEMENHIFLKARTKEEYLLFVARLILHVKAMNSNCQPFSGVQKMVGHNPGIIIRQQFNHNCVLRFGWRI